MVSQVCPAMSRIEVKASVTSSASSLASALQAAHAPVSSFFVGALRYPRRVDGVALVVGEGLCTQIVRGAGIGRGVGLAILDGVAIDQRQAVFAGGVHHVAVGRPLALALVAGVVHHREVGVGVLLHLHTHHLPAARVCCGHALTLFCWVGIDSPLFSSARLQFRDVSLRHHALRHSCEQQGEDCKYFSFSHLPFLFVYEYRLKTVCLRQLPFPATSVLTDGDKKNCGLPWFVPRKAVY